jgi:hypothetical protein
LDSACYHLRALSPTGVNYLEVNTNPMDRACGGRPDRRIRYVHSRHQKRTGSLSRNTCCDRFGARNVSDDCTVHGADAPSCADNHRACAATFRGTGSAWRQLGAPQVSCKRPSAPAWFEGKHQAQRRSAPIGDVVARITSNGSFEGAIQELWQRAVRWL